MKHWVFVATSGALVALLVAACGGGDEPAAASPPKTTTTPDAAIEPEVSVVLLDGVADSFGRDVQAEMSAIITFFDEQFEVRVDGITVYVANDTDALAEAFYNVSGWEFPGILCASGPGTVIFVVADLCRHKGFLVLDHEYFHILQDNLAAFGADYEAYRQARGPGWLTEGTAEYAATMYRAATTPHTFVELRDDYVLAAASWDGSLEASEEPVGRERYFLGFLAVEMLVERAGEETVVEYYRRLSPSTPWREAFRDVFGIDVDDFYKAFEVDRAESTSRYATIRGTVLGPDGAGLGGIGLLAWTGDAETSADGGTAGDGSFVLAVPEAGTFAILIYLPPRGQCTLIGRYKKDTGFTSSSAEATEIAVEGEDVTGIQIRLPEGWEELPYVEHCAQ